MSPYRYFDLSTLLTIATSYMYTGAFIGALVGFAIAGLISDPSIKLLSRWNNGIYEPEFRMILVVPQLILGCAGLYGFGIVSNDVVRYSWVSPTYTGPQEKTSHADRHPQFPPDFFFGLEVAGMVLGAVASALYIVDAPRDIAIEAFTCLLVFKNIFSFGLTFHGLDWLIQGGVKPVFMAIASVQVAVCCTTIVMCKFSSYVYPCFFLPFC